jgi:hypothetical protein
MNPDAIADLQKWLDGPEPGTQEPTIRTIINTSAGTLWQQALVRLLQAIAPQPISNKEPIV